MLETNIDDMSPEYYEVVFEKLYRNSAIEVFITPVIMKKSRPAVVLSVICYNEDKEKLKEIIFRETFSIGIREYFYNRTKLIRKNVLVKTKYGKIKVKLSYINNELINIKPEYDFCKEISMKKNISFKEIIRETMYIVKNQIEDDLLN
jgi:pyridinium-3,5-bisthiocarboxylic acid mononucleotide nickel chelatase